MSKTKRKQDRTPTHQLTANLYDSFSQVVAEGRMGEHDCYLNLKPGVEMTINGKRYYDIKLIFHPLVPSKSGGPVG